MYVIQHCFICRPSDTIVSEDAGIEPRTVSTVALTTRGQTCHKYEVIEVMTVSWALELQTMFFNEHLSIISSLTLLFAGRERSGHLTGFHTGCGPPNRYNTCTLMSYIVKKVIIFPVPRRDVIYNIIPGRE